MGERPCQAPADQVRLRHSESFVLRTPWPWPEVAPRLRKGLKQTARSLPSLSLHPEISLLSTYTVNIRSRLHPWIGASPPLPAVHGALHGKLLLQCSPAWRKELQTSSSGWRLRWARTLSRLGPKTAWQCLASFAAQQPSRFGFDEVLHMKPLQGYKFIKNMERTYNTH